MAIDPVVIHLSVDAADAAHSVSEFVREARNQMENQLTTSVDKVKTKLDELGRKYMSISEAIAENRRRIEELNTAKEKASGDDKRRIEQEAAALKRITDGREVELLKIDEKRVKLQELFSMSQATTDAERNGIKGTTDLRLAENAALRDQARAHNAVTEEIKQGSSALQQYVGGFIGLQSVVGIIDSVWKMLERARKEMNQTTDAAAKLRDLSQGENDRNTQFFQEFGLNTADDKKYGGEAINGIARRFNLQPSTVSRAAGNIAPSLKASGVTDFTSERFKSLVGTAGLAQERGIDTGQLASIFQDNPNITGSGLDAQLNSVLGVTKGSASRANSLLQGYQENRLRLHAGGVRNFDDYLKLYQRLGKRIAPEEVPNAIRQFASASDKFAFGKTEMEKGELAMQLGAAGAGSLSSIVTRSGPIDPLAVYDAMGQLDPEVQDRAARVLGTGSRGGVALSAAAGFRNEVLPQGSGQLMGAVTPEERTAVQMGIARADTAEDNRPDPNAERFRSEVELMKTHLLAHPEEMNQYANQYSDLRTQFPNLTDWVDGSSERNLQKQASQIVYLKHMQNLANWKAKNPSAAPQIDPIINQYMQNMQSDDAVMDPKTAAPGFGTEDAVLQKLRQPATQPATQPTSINYHIRQTNYGASYDSIGAPESYDTRYS